MKTGLVLGKFAPLHHGHQLLIDTALRENDRVIAIVYNAPDVTRLPLPVRAGWIKALYPEVVIIEAWDGPMEVGDSPELQSMHEDYLRKALGSEIITAFYSSEFYGDHVSKSLGAIDRRIDPDRVQVPVSGTRARQDAYAHRELIDPVVYWDLITKVVFLGAPSTGKTTLAEALADKFDTVWMPEYGREYWEANQIDRRLTAEQMVEIAQGHREREEMRIQDANRYLFIDTDATTTYTFSMYYHGEADPRLNQYAEATVSRYDLFFLCETDIPYDDTWDRSGDANRELFQEQIKADLFDRRIPYIPLTGSLMERIERVSEILERYVQGMSLGELFQLTEALLSRYDPKQVMEGFRRWSFENYWTT